MDDLGVSFGRNLFVELKIFKLIFVCSMMI
jgi:hypothetical protein